MPKRQIIEYFLLDTYKSLKLFCNVHIHTITVVPEVLEAKVEITVK